MRLPRRPAGRPIRDLTGTNVGELYVIELAERPEGKKYRGAWWRVRCSCDAELVIPANRLTGWQGRPAQESCLACYPARRRVPDELRVCSGCGRSTAGTRSSATECYACARRRQRATKKEASCEA